MSAAPEKARRQADLAVADLSAAQHLLAVAETKRAEAEAALRGVSDQLRQRQVCRKTASRSVLLLVAAATLHTQHLYPSVATVCVRDTGMLGADATSVPQLGCECVSFP